MSINENMFLENYMTSYNNGEKICIIYKNNPIKSNINNHSVLAIVMFQETFIVPKTEVVLHML